MACFFIPDGENMHVIAKLTSTRSGGLQLNPGVEKPHVIRPLLVYQVEKIGFVFQRCYLSDNGPSNQI